MKKLLHQLLSEKYTELNSVIDFHIVGDQYIVNCLIAYPQGATNSKTVPDLIGTAFFIDVRSLEAYVLQKVNLQPLLSRSGITTFN